MVKREGAKILRWDESGEGCRIEWIDKKGGERVVGCFTLVGWAWGTPEFRAEVDKVLRSPPLVTYREKPHRSR